MKSYKFDVYLILVTSLLFAVQPKARDYDWIISAKVLSVQPNSMPKTAFFRINKNVRKCKTNNWLRWDINGSTPSDKQQNAKKNYNILMKALVSYRTVKIYGRDLNCSVVSVENDIG